MAVTGPNTGFKIVNADGGPTTQDLGQRYVSKDYLLDVYPSLASTTGTRTSPGLWSTYGGSSPVQVGTLTNWKQLPFNGSYGLTFGAIKTDGTLWTWGQNPDGQLGQNNTTSGTSPVQVGALTNWKQIAFGFYDPNGWTLAIKTDGTLWAWGYNLYGARGNGSPSVKYSSPVQVGSLTNWKQVTAGRLNSAAVKTDGTLWTWGYGTDGNLGQNTTTTTSAPGQVGTLTNWKQVSSGYDHMAAVKTDGTLWTWGLNTFGQLGLNDRTTRSSPVQVGTLTNWKQVLVSIYQSVAIKTDGTLWTWGINNRGQLGLNDSTNRSSPVQVGSLTNWKQVSSGYGNMVAIKTDGTLWTWGLNNYGQLGLNDSTERSSPVQVGSLTNWKQATTLGAGDATGTTMYIADGYY